MMEQVEKNETKKKPVFKKWWFWLIIVVLLIGIIAAAGSKSKDNAPDTSTADSVSEKESAAQNSESTEKAKDIDYEIGEGNVRVWKSSIGSDWISVAIPVKNTGSKNLYLSAGTMDIEDASGAMVTSLSMVSVYPQVIQPGETAYYYQESTLEESISAEGLKIVPHVDVKASKVDCVRFTVSEEAVKTDSLNDVKVTGRVENTSDEAQNMVYVVANLYDKDGGLLVQQFTILTDELQPGEKIGFSTSNLGYSFSAEDVADFEVFAFPQQYQF